jgi:hypothetical protein
MLLLLVKVCPNEESELEVILIVLAKERAQAMLAKARARKERELQKEKNKNKLMLRQVEGQENIMDDIERREMLDLEGNSKLSSGDDSGDFRNPESLCKK